MEHAQLIQKVNALSFTATPTQLESALAALTAKQEKRDLVTSKTAAEISGLHPETVKRYARAGILHPFIVGRRKLRFDRREIVALANGELSAVNQ